MREDAQNPRAELESRVTALLLGELTPEQAAGLREIMAHDPELAKLHERLKKTIELVRETEACDSTFAAREDVAPAASLQLGVQSRPEVGAPSASGASKASEPKLGAERREKLRQRFKTVKPKEFAKPRPRQFTWLVPVAAAAMLMMVLSAMFLPALSKSKAKAQRVARYYEHRLLGPAESASVVTALPPPATPALPPTPTAAPEPSPVLAENSVNLQVANGLQQSVLSPGQKQLFSESKDPAAFGGRTLVSAGTVVAPAEKKPADSVDAPAKVEQRVDGDGGVGQRFYRLSDSDESRRLGKDSWFGMSTDGTATTENAGSLGVAGNADVSGIRAQGGAMGGGGGARGVLSGAMDHDVGAVFGNGSDAKRLPQVGDEDGRLAGRWDFTLNGGNTHTGGTLVEGKAGETVEAVRRRVDRSEDGTKVGSGTLTITTTSGRQSESRMPSKPVEMFDYESSREANLAYNLQNPETGKPLDKNLGEQLAKAKVNLEEAQRSRQMLAGKAADTAADEGTSSMLLTSETLRRIEVLRIESKAELVRQESLLNKLKTTKPDDLAQAIPTSVQDSQLGSLLEQKTMAEQRLASLKKEYGPQNAEVQKASAMMEDLRKKIKERTDGMLLGQEAKVEALQKNLDNLQEEVNKARQAELEKANQSQPYWEAKRILDERQRFRQMLATKIAAERTDLDLPKSTMVEIVDRAVPASSRSGTLLERIGGKAGYVSKARIKLDREPTEVQALAKSEPALGYDPYFVQTDFEAIQSEAVLGKVVEKLKLADEWGKEGEEGRKLSNEETVARLKKKLELNAVKGTGLLEIGVKSDKPEEAARIANAIAEVYQDQRQAERRRLTVAGIEALSNRIAEADKKAAEAQQEVDRLQREAARQQLDLPAAKPATPPPVPQPEIQARENRFSTFSLNVSDVAFKVAAAALERGVMPDASGMRSEEFLNAFDYRDPEPPAGTPIGFVWERAGYPFAQNRDLLRFSLKTAAQGRQAGCPLNLVLLLDNSGSMERADRVQIIREALRVLAGQLQAEDKFSVVTFARTARLWVDGVPGSQAGQVAEQVGGLTPQGGTNLEEAMNLAYRIALRHYLANGINRVVLLTDGAANLGDVDPDTLKRKVEEHRKQGIALDCFGIGWEGYNDDLLEVLTRNGDGRYGFINTPEEAATGFAGQLAGALQVAASDVKVQVEFNPSRVSAYRQIGYAKHQLTKEQFRDNTVDAAEIGAAESGNALYVIEVNPQGIGPLATVRARYKAPGTSDYREMEWVVPYNGNSAPLDKASAAMRLAASASAFAEWLALSPYAGEVSPDRLIGILTGVPQVYGADARPKKLEWMIRQAKSIARR